MTRKRFIKLCMGYEVQRNEAERIASAAIKEDSYEQFWAGRSFMFERRYNANMAIRGWVIELDLSGCKDMSCAIE